MAIAFVDKQVAVYSSASALLVNRPASNIGDLLIAVVSIDTTETGTPDRAVTPPDGWTLLLRTNSAANLAQLIYYRTVTDTEAPFYTWTIDMTGVVVPGFPAVVAVLAYTGVQAIDTAAGATSTTAFIMAPSIVQAQEDETLLSIFGTAGNYSLVTAPDGTTARLASGSSMLLVVCDELRGPDEATGNRVAVVSGVEETVGQMVALIAAPTVEAPFKDNYKSKVMRGSVPSPPFDTRLSGNLGKILTILGTSDNDIGGQFGADDPLPDETV